MPIPDYQKLMLPTLTLLSDQKEHNAREFVDNISNQFNLSEEEKSKLLPSGQESIIVNRLRWSIWYMKKAELLQTTKRGYVKITDRGLTLLSQKPAKIDNNLLSQFPEFIKVRNLSSKVPKESQKNNLELKETPEELIEKGSWLINSSLSDELLKEVRRCDPYYFEHIVGNLLSAIGYGEFEATSRSNDGGVDGIVNQDKLGLDKIYFQAKRYDEANSVSQSQIRDFIGTLELKGSNKGVFITTSDFPRNIEKVLSRTPKSISLIDGQELVRLMIENDIGVNTHKIYKVKKIDYDFFSETII